MVTRETIADAVGSVLDPHLPFGLRDLGMLESVCIDQNGNVQVTITMPCHHCPGLDQMRDNIVSAARRAGAHGEVRVSFLGSEKWNTARVTEPARAGLSAFGVQIARADNGRECQ
jgi:metal-sulfur cluster biosynthetic enzyme